MTTLADTFGDIKRIGCGFYGKVYTCYDKLDKNINAIKQIGIVEGIDPANEIAIHKGLTM